MHSPRSVDEDGFVFFNHNAAARRHGDSEDQQRPFSPTIRQRPSVNYRLFDERRDNFPGLSHESESETPYRLYTDSSFQVQASRSIQNSPQFNQQVTNRQNTEVIDILYSITNVLTQMSSELNSIKSIQANTQNNPQMQPQVR